MNSKVIKSKASALVKSLVKVSHAVEKRQGDRVEPNGGKEEKLIPQMLFGGLLSTAFKSGKSKERNSTRLSDTKLEIEVICQ